MKPKWTSRPCTGCGLCETICPAVSQLGDGGSEVDCQGAADACPTARHLG